MQHKFHEWLKIRDEDLYNEYDWNKLGSSAALGGMTGAGFGALSSLTDPNVSWAGMIPSMIGRGLSGAMGGAATGAATKGIYDMGQHYAKQWFPQAATTNQPVKDVAAQPATAQPEAGRFGSQRSKGVPLAPEQLKLAKQQQAQRDFQNLDREMGQRRSLKSKQKAYRGAENVLTNLGKPKQLTAQQQAQKNYQDYLNNIGKKPTGAF